MKEMAGKEGERRLSKIGIEQMMVSLGHQSCGALTLWNYPSWMRDLIVHDINGEDRSNPVDMAALESNKSIPYLSFSFFHLAFSLILIKLLYNQSIETGREELLGTMNSEETY